MNQEAGGEPVAGGHARDAKGTYPGPALGKILGRFQAHKGTRYRLGVLVKRTSPELQATHPHIKIAIDPRPLKTDYAWVTLLIISATCCLLLAVVLLLLSSGRWLGPAQQ